MFQTRVAEFHNLLAPNRCFLFEEELLCVIRAESDSARKTEEESYGKTYYADFTDTSGTRRRLSLQTTNLKVAQLKYAEIIHKRNTIKEKMVVDLEWDAFKIRLFKFMLAERSKSTITWTKLAIQHLEEIQKPQLLRDVPLY